GDSVPESFLAGFRAAGELRRSGDARVRCRVGWGGLEDARRAYRECVVAVFVRRLEWAADDGLEQYRADHRSAARCESSRDRGSEAAVSESCGDCVADGGIEAR